MTIQRTVRSIEEVRGNFTLACRSGFLLAAVFGALCLSPAPATADFVTFDLNAAILDYDADADQNAVSGTLIVTENIGSDFQVRRENNTNVLDSVEISGDNDDFNFVFTLDMVKGLAEQWLATGILGFTDANGGTDAVIGNFVSNDISIISYGPGFLQIIGTLNNDSPSILQNRGDPWTFVGDSSIPGEASGGDAVIGIGSPGDYDDGSVFVLKIGAGTHSLDALFGSDFIKYGGEVKGMVTPEPATMSLLALGGLAVLRKRRKQ